jgi:hypothetical protein
VVVYQGKVRQAVREVEDALGQVCTAPSRACVMREVVRKGYAESLLATQSRFDHGLASLMELEDARRSALAAQSASAGPGSWSASCLGGCTAPWAAALSPTRWLRWPPRPQTQHAPVEARDDTDIPLV